MKKVMGLTDTIKHHFDCNTKKGISTTVICTAILAAITFGFNNASLPKQEKQINNVDSKTTALISKDSAKTIQIILLRNDINGVNKKVDVVQSDMEKGFERIEKRLEKIINQTK